MTDDRSIERAARSWLEVGPTRAPERAVEAALVQIETTTQERDWHVPWRLPKMTTPLRVASAAVIGVFVVGGALYALAPASSGPGAPPPTASPTPSASSSASASPSTAPSASAMFPSWYTDGGNGAGILTAGSQATRSFLPGFTFTVPGGWVNSGDEVGFFGLFPDTPANQAEFAASGDIAQAIHMGPQNDPYFTCDAWEDNQGATAAEIVAAMVANDALATSEPVDVTIGGLTGKQVDVRLDPGWTESCPGDPPGFDPGDGRTRAILLDTPDRGVIVIFLGSLHSAGHEAFLAEAMPIIESFHFDIGQ